MTTLRSKVANLKKQTKKTITGWALQVTWSDGREETITEIDGETANAVDNFLTELEDERATLE